MMPGKHPKQPETPAPAIDSMESLAGRSREGCRESFETLARLVRPRLAFALRRSVACDADIEDLTQQTLLRCWEQLHRYEPTRRFMPWLLTIAFRLAVDQSRRRRGYEPLPESAVSPTEQPHETLHQQEQHERVWAIAQRVLNEPQWTALWLQYGESMSPREIAKAMGRTTVATRVLLHRARQALRPHLLDMMDQASDAQPTEAHRSIPASLNLTGATR
jgi:RNA polymerase sigma-70 factor (ECF subfamily)